METSGRHHALLSGTNPGINALGGYVSPRAGLVVLEEKNLLLGDSNTGQSCS